MPFAKIEPSGSGLVKGVAKLRIDLFLEETDPHYDKCYVQVPVIPEGGYPGKVKGDGSPIDQKDYDAWLESLPHIWQNNPFHSHKIWLPVSPSDNSVKEQIERTLNYFYTFHQHCWDTGQQFCGKDKDGNIVGLWERVPFKKGSIRDVFVKGDPKDSLANQQKIADVLSRVQEFQIGVSRVPPTDLNIGEKGTITIGTSATNRASTLASGYTEVDRSVAGACSGDGEIDTVQIYPNTTMSNVEVAIFEEVSTNHLTTRSNEPIGTVTAGAPDPDVFTGLTMDCVAGDHLGIYFSAGALERDASGNAWYLLSDYIPCTNQIFTTSAFVTMSLYGTGTESGGGETYECAATDGLAVGDANIPNRIMNCLATDGLKPGESTAGSGRVYPNVATDGITMSEVIATLLSARSIATDGLAIGDTSTSQGNFRVIALDGSTLSETLGTLLSTFPTITDGISLGDLPSIAGQVFELAASDGVKLGEVLAGKINMTLVLLDGAKVGESLTGCIVCSLILTDGTDVGDTPVTQAFISSILSEGIKVGDSSISSLTYVIINTDGVSIGDSAVIITPILIHMLLRTTSMVRMTIDMVGN